MNDACRSGALDTVRRVFAGYVVYGERACPEEALMSACEGGDLQTVKHMYFNVPDRENYALKALVQCCRHGNIHAARWIKSVASPTPEEICDDGIPALQWACIGRHLRVVRWLVNEFELTADDAREAAALAGACVGGSPMVVKWLANRFGLTPDDARADDNEALREACSWGRLEAAQLLAARFGLTRRDASALNSEALRHACTYGHLEVAQWLADKFVLKAQDAREMRNEALRGACVNGHLRTVRWLVQRFNLRARDARSMGNYALHGACANGHVDVVQWLLLRFRSLTSTDTRSSYRFDDPEITRILDQHYAGRR